MATGDGVHSVMATENKIYFVVAVAMWTSLYKFAQNKQEYFES